MNNYEKDLEIDKLSLDEEWLNQPQLFRKYSQLKAEAKQKLDKVNEKLKTVRSELIMEAKQGGEKLLGCKATDPVTEAYYRTHDKYKKIKQEVIQAEFEFNIYDGAVFAFNQRKTALENLVRLFIGDYYSEPSEPKGSNIKKQSIDTAENRQRKRLNKKLKT